MIQSFYQYFKNNTWELTEEWFESIDKSKSGVYASDSNEKINKLKSQNHDFHKIFSELFDDNVDCVETAFDEWIDQIASDKAHLNTPLPEIIDEFFRNQSIYMSFIESYALEHNLSFRDYHKYIKIIVSSYEKLILAFIKRNEEKANRLLHSQRELITDLSSPVIKLNENIALLPLVGAIDTQRAKSVFEKTLETCSNEKIHCLLIDLSGVPIVDTMVANELFQLVTGLKLVGTKASLSGIRPELAQTSIQLGIDFSQLQVFSSISKALSKLDFNTVT